MSEFAGIDRFIETSGPDKGRIKDIDVAWEVAVTEDAWREENDGKPMLSPPERVGKSPFHFSQLIEMEIKRVIIDTVTAEVTEGLGTIHEQTHDPSSDPEEHDERWFSWKIANTVFNSFEGRGFDYDTCNDIAAQTFPEAFETAYSYLTQSGIDADEVLSDFIQLQQS